MRTRTKLLGEATTSQIRKLDDVLDMTVRELLQAVVNKEDGWVDIRCESYPWRRIVEAAERGECEVSRVGRRLMMQREELNRWLSSRRIHKENKSDATAIPEDEMQRRVRRSLERQGYTR